jgi:hypothetical protein
MQDMAKVPSIDDLPISTNGLIDVASPTSVMLNRFEGSFCDRAMARSLGLRKVEMGICLVCQLEMEIVVLRYHAFNCMGDH